MNFPVLINCPKCKSSLIPSQSSCDVGSNLFTGVCVACSSSYLVRIKAEIVDPNIMERMVILPPKSDRPLSLSYKDITVTGCTIHEGPRPDPDFSRFTDGSRKLFVAANQEAIKRNHEYVGTEHLLLAITSVPCMARGILRQFPGTSVDSDVGLDRVRQRILALIQPDGSGITLGKLPLTPRVHKVIELANENSRILGKDYVGTEHILDALMLEGGGIAHQVLDESGYKVDVPLYLEAAKPGWTRVVFQSDSGDLVAEANVSFDPQLGPAPFVTGTSAINPCPKPTCGGDRFVDGYSSTGRMWLTCRSCGTTTPINVGDDGYIPRVDEHQ